MSHLLLILLLAGPASVGQTLFVYKFAKHTTWKETKVGQVLMVKSASLCALVNVALLNELMYLTGSPTWINVSTGLEMIAYLLVTIAIWWKLYTLVRYQRGDYDNDVK